MEIPEKSPNLLCKKSSPDLKLMFEWHHLRSMRQCDRNKCLDGSFVLYISIYLLHIGKENVSVLSISVSANIYEIYRYRYFGIFPGICYDITFIILLLRNSPEMQNSLENFLGQPCTLSFRPLKKSLYLLVPCSAHLCRYYRVSVLVIIYRNYRIPIYISVEGYRWNTRKCHRLIQKSKKPDWKSRKNGHVAHVLSSLPIQFKFACIELLSWKY